MDVQEIHQSATFHTSPIRALAHNPGMCPDWESKQQRLGVQAGAQSAELHQPGPNLYFLIPSPPHPLPQTPLPSGNHKNALHIRDSVSVLVCLVYFLDSVVDRYVFIATLLLIVLIFFLD